ncbi:MAG: hypothetical protein ACYS8L_07350 [Planctomycetota bacterium]
MNADLVVGIMCGLLAGPSMVSRCLERWCGRIIEGSAQGLHLAWQAGRA